MGDFLFVCFFLFYVLEGLRNPIQMQNFPKIIFFFFYLFNVQVSFDTTHIIFLNLTTSSEIQMSYWHFKHHVLHLIRWLVNQPLIAEEREGKTTIVFLWYD